MNAVAGTRELSRLHWQCRRGMLELDLFLMGFLDREYAGLAEKEKHAFQRLLEIPDQELLELLMEERQAEEREIADVIKKIRAAVAD